MRELSSVWKIQTERLGQEHRHLPASEGAVRAVVSPAASSGYARCHQGLDELELRTRCRNVPERRRCRRRADLKHVIDIELDDRLTKPRSRIRTDRGKYRVREIQVVDLMWGDKIDCEAGGTAAVARRRQIDNLPGKPCYRGFG